MQTAVMTFNKSRHLKQCGFERYCLLKMFKLGDSPQSEFLPRETLSSFHWGHVASQRELPQKHSPDHPLLNLSKAARDRLLITPHIAGTTKSAFQRMLSQAIANIAAVAAGHPPKHVVNRVLKSTGAQPLHQEVIK